MALPEVQPLTCALFRFSGSNFAGQTLEMRVLSNAIEDFVVYFHCRNRKCEMKFVRLGVNLHRHGHVIPRALSSPSSFAGTYCEVEQ